MRKRKNTKKQSKKANSKKKEAEMKEQEKFDNTDVEVEEGKGQDKVEEQSSSAKEEVAELKDKYIRLLAEFENFRKRTVREKMDLISTAAENTITALLPVLDDFDRAKKSADDENTNEVFSEGVSLVYEKLYSILKSNGLGEIESTGLPFDVEEHEAITEIPAPDDSLKGKVVDTVEKGYKLNDKIIRHAKVVVGM
jgi:molecular chaperone GrpE